MRSLVDIHKSYGRGKWRVQILCEVSLSVAGGEIVGILGPCGEESEALLEAAACAVQPDKGQVRLDQIDLTRLKRATREELRVQAHPKCGQSPVRGGNRAEGPRLCRPVPAC